jgi:hypothetical protein
LSDSDFGLPEQIWGVYAALVLWNLVCLCWIDIVARFGWWLVVLVNWVKPFKGWWVEFDWSCCSMLVFFGLFLLTLKQFQKHERLFPNCRSTVRVKVTHIIKTRNRSLLRRMSLPFGRETTL